MQFQLQLGAVSSFAGNTAQLQQEKRHGVMFLETLSL